MKLKELAKKGLCLCLSAATLAGVCSSVSYTHLTLPTTERV